MEKDIWRRRVRTTTYYEKVEIFFSSFHTLCENLCTPTYVLQHIFFHGKYFLQ